MLSPSLFVLTLRNPSLAVIELSLWADKKIELPNHFTSLPLPERKGVRVPNTLQVEKENYWERENYKFLFGRINDANGS